MLIIRRKLNETITIGDDIVIKVCEINFDRQDVKIGIQAPASVHIVRDDAKVQVPKKKFDPDIIGEI